MKIKINFLSLLAGLSIFATGAMPLRAQTLARNTPTVAHAQPSDSDPAAMLPASDVIVVADVKRLLNDALPLFFSGNEEGLADVNAEIAKFKSETGLDPRSFDRVAVGIKLDSPRTGVTTGDTVCIARGSFQAGAMIAAGKIAAKGQYEEQKYGGNTIYIFNLNDAVKVGGLVNTKVNKLAVSALNSNTLAVGDLNMVEAAIDGKTSPANADLISMANRTPGAFFGFGANLPADIADGVSFANDEIAKNLNSIKQVYGSATVAGTQLDVFAAARTHNAEEAESLNDTLNALKQFGNMFVSQLKPDQAKLAAGALENLKIVKSGSEVQLSLSIPRDDIATLMRSVNKKKS